MPMAKSKTDSIAKRGNMLPRIKIDTPAKEIRWEHDAWPAAEGAIVTIAGRAIVKIAEWPAQKSN